MVRGFLKRFRTIDSLYLTGYFTYSWSGKEQLAALLFFFASPPPLFISLFIHSSPEVFFHLFPSLKVYHHHHYHKIELARYSMTRSFHLSLSSIAIGSSSSLHPEGLFNGIFINLIIFYCIPWGFLSYWACTGFMSCFLGFSPGNQNFPKPCCCSLLFLSAFGSNTTPHWRYIN